MSSSRLQTETKNLPATGRTTLERFMLKRLSSIALIVTLANAPLAIAEESVEDIVGSYIEARGGLD